MQLAAVDLKLNGLGKINVNQPSAWQPVKLVLCLALLVMGLSIYFDWENDLFTWFQRSGSFIVLIGAVLGYRGIVRLGKEGLGGTSSVISEATLVESYYTEDGRSMAKVKYSPEELARLKEIETDKLAGYISAILAVIGTFIWGYGDLLVKLIIKI